MIAGLVLIAAAPFTLFGAGVLTVASGGICAVSLAIPIYQIQSGCQVLNQGMNQLARTNCSVKEYHQRINEQKELMERIRGKTSPESEAVQEQQPDNPSPGSP